MIGRASPAAPSAEAGCSSCVRPGSRCIADLLGQVLRSRITTATRPAATTQPSPRRMPRFTAASRTACQGSSGILAGSPGMPPDAMKTDRTRVVPGRPVGRTGPAVQDPGFSRAAQCAPSRPAIAALRPGQDLPPAFRGGLIDGNGIVEGFRKSDHTDPRYTTHAEHPASGPGVALPEPSMIVQKQLQRQTRGHRDMHDLTDGPQRLVEESGITRGIASLCNVGSTAALGTIEFEPGLEEDLPMMLDRLIPPDRELRPRARLARRQWAFPPAGDPARAQPDRADRRRPSAAGHLAAGLPARVRRQAQAAHRHRHNRRGVRQPEDSRGVRPRTS